MLHAEPGGSSNEDAVRHCWGAGAAAWGGGGANEPGLRPHQPPPEALSAAAPTEAGRSRRGGDLCLCIRCTWILTQLILRGEIILYTECPFE